MFEDLGAWMLLLAVIAVPLALLVRAANKHQREFKNRKPVEPLPPPPPRRTLEEVVAEQERIREAGNVFGKHYTEYVGSLGDLLADGKDAEFEELSLKIIEASEREAKVAGFKCPAPAYTKKLAIFYRKQKRYADEIALLERFERAGGTGFTERLTKARELRAKQKI